MTTVMKTVMKTVTKAMLKSMLGALVSSSLVVGCGEGGSSPRDAAPADAGTETPPDASCFENPTTHHEIINACTTAQKIYKDSHPPLLGPDGSLPPLP